MEFVKRHRLSGIIGHEDKAMAIIDGAWLIIGRSLDGCLLVAASENEARFSCFDGQAIIRVITDPTQGND